MAEGAAVDDVGGRGVGASADDAGRCTIRASAGSGTTASTIVP
jgi:hypothetical protein